MPFICCEDNGLRHLAVAASEVNFCWKARRDEPGREGPHSTSASGINNAGQIVGFFSDARGTHGFLRSSGGVFTTLDDPLATDGTEAFGINNAGQIVEKYQDA